MKIFKTLILVSIVSVVLLSESCNSDPEDLDSVNIIPEVKFSLSGENETYLSTGQPHNVDLAYTISGSDESLIVNYVKFHSFAFADGNAENIGIHLHYVVDIFDNPLDVDSAFLSESKANQANFLIDQTSFSGFGVTFDLQMSDNTRWYSYENYVESLEIEGVDQSNSEFDIYEVIELDTATFIKAGFNCNLYNESGNVIRLESGELTLRLD